LRNGIIILICKQKKRLEGIEALFHVLSWLNPPESALNLSNGQDQISPLAFA